MASYALAQNIVKPGDWKPDFDPSFDVNGSTYFVDEVTFNPALQAFTVVGDNGQPLDVTGLLNFAQKRQFNGFDMNAPLIKAEGKRDPKLADMPLADERLTSNFYKGFQLVPTGGILEKLLASFRWLVYAGIAGVALYLIFDAWNTFKPRK